MSKEKQILQLLRDGYSQRRAADTLSVSRNTVAKVARAAADHNITGGRIDAIDEAEIRKLLFPEESRIPVLVTPDFPYIH